jgi:hypothetical protein
MNIWRKVDLFILVSEKGQVLPHDELVLARDQCLSEACSSSPVTPTKHVSIASATEIGITSCCASFNDTKVPTNLILSILCVLS